MKIFVLNGPKTAYTAFAALCVFVIVYVGFFAGRDAVAVSSEALEPCYVAVVIDDFGNGRDGTKEFLYMDIPYTGAVMPAMPYTAEESRQLHENGKDVILHMPMEPHKGDASWLGAQAITEDLSTEQIREYIELNISEVNYCIGINNHMGSKIMENEEILGEVFSAAKEKGLIFIDSMTTNKSKAAGLAEEYGVRLFERDVFLDGTQDVKKIEKNLRSAGEIARERGYAIAIGHVGEEGGKVTAQAMKNVKPEFDQQNIQYVTLTELMALLDAAE